MSRYQRTRFPFPSSLHEFTQNMNIQISLRAPEHLGYAYLIPDLKCLMSKTSGCSKPKKTAGFIWAAFKQNTLALNRQGRSAALASCCFCYSCQQTMMGPLLSRGRGLLLVVLLGRGSCLWWWCILWGRGRGILWWRSSLRSRGILWCWGILRRRSVLRCRCWCILWLRGSLRRILGCRRRCVLGCWGRSILGRRCILRCRCVLRGRSRGRSRGRGRGGSWGRSILLLLLLGCVLRLLRCLCILRLLRRRRILRGWCVLLLLWGRCILLLLWGRGILLLGLTILLGCVLWLWSSMAFLTEVGDRRRRGALDVFI
mmetsp:Transcript_30316/g.48992  ORF Transcript_30316/g.48992 Transcript_30316/m.48992 type:complete len:314 (-) Transcript_30316:655-1596(-)